jgi:hypothetical protein
MSNCQQVEENIIPWRPNNEIDELVNHLAYTCTSLREAPLDGNRITAESLRRSLNSVSFLNETQ